MNKLISVFLILIFYSPSWASVNMRNGSYSETWVDYIDPGKGIEMKIERFYSSRSVYSGLFGFGWCSFLETHLTITSDGIINLTECGGGLEITYYPKDFDLKSPEDTIKQIINDYKTKNKMSATDIANLRTQLRSNTKMRFEYANELGLINIKKIKTKNQVFYSKNKGRESINFNGDYYERRRFDGRVEKFDQKGKLVQYSNQAGQTIRIEYSGKKIRYLVDKSNGRRLNFKYNIPGNGKLKKIYNGQGLEVTYKFNGENLVAVNNMWSKDYSFVYDTNHNLIQVDFPDKTSIQMTYNIQKDWIKTYTNRIQCVETFNFLLSKDDPQNHYWSVHTNACPGDPVGEGRHEFWYKNYSFSKDKYLNRVKENYLENFKDAYFHPYLGQVITKRENYLYQGFAYYLNGLMNKREYKLYGKNRDIVTWNKMTFAYDKNKDLPKESKKSNLDNKGKVTSKEVMKYKYNRKGFLEKATNNNGDSLTIKYDSNGRIASMQDHTQAQLKLNYKVGIKKPVEIEQVGVGKIAISYDPQGAIKNVEFSGNRNVSTSTSVVQKFLEMIDFLGPLGESLKI